MKFAILIYTDATLLDALPKGQFDAKMRDCLAHADDLKKDGRLLESQMLEGAATAKSVLIPREPERRLIAWGSMLTDTAGRHNALTAVVAVSTHWVRLMTPTAGLVGHGNTATWLSPGADQSQTPFGKIACKRAMKDAGINPTVYARAGTGAGAPPINGVIRSTSSIAGVPYASISVGSNDGVPKSVIFEMVVEPNTLALGLLFTLIMGALGGLLPAWTAMRPATSDIGARSGRPPDGEVTVS